MTKKFDLLIVAALGLVAPAYAQSIRVITGNIEHVYGHGGQILDDDALRARNERAERELQVKRSERDRAARQEEAEKSLAHQAAAVDYEQISTGLLLGAPVRVRHFPTRPKTQLQIGSSRPIPR